MNFKTAFLRTITVSALIFASLGLLTAQGTSADSIYKLPAGTRIRLKMDVELSSKVAGLNDTFTASVAKPVLIRDTIVVPAGTVVEGRVRGVSAARSGGTSGKLDVIFESLRIINSQPRKIEGELVNKIARPSSSMMNVLSIVGGTVAGALFGAAVKGGSGALIGAGAGAGVGTGVALFRKGKNVRIREDEEFEIELKKDVVLPVLDY